jgi:hypothetical protein
MMWDPSTGRAYDGLQRHGVNRNEGAESALALIGTLHDLARVEVSLTQRGARADD